MPDSFLDQSTDVQHACLHLNEEGRMISAHLKTSGSEDEAWRKDAAGFLGESCFSREVKTLEYTVTSTEDVNLDSVN